MHEPQNASSIGTTNCRRNTGVERAVLERDRRRVLGEQGNGVGAVTGMERGAAAGHSVRGNLTIDLVTLREDASRG